MDRDTNITQLSESLTNFANGLPTGQRALFAGMMEATYQSLQDARLNRGEVGGFDEAGPVHDLIQGINWNALSTNLPTGGAVNLNPSTDHRQQE